MGATAVRLRTGVEAEHNVVRETLAVAAAASENGQWARVHTVFQSKSEALEGSGGSVFIVGVFDAPIPLGREDEDADAFSARIA